MKTQIADYTIKRRSQSIRICPECGRKGLYRRVSNKYHVYDDYIHKAKIVIIGGVPFNEITDYHSVNYQKISRER